MAKLQVILNGKMVEEFRLTRGRVSIGRRRNSDIMLDSPVVSGDHALIERIGSVVYLEDRESTNGTRRNGKKVKREPLHYGDEIGIGRYTLRYVNDDAPAQPGFEKTLMMTEIRMGGNHVDTRPVVEDPHVVKAIEAKKAAQTPLGVLSFMSGSNAGRELVLNKAVTTLGKAGLEVAVVARQAKGYFISSMEGTPGPRLNGQVISSCPQALKAGDKVDLLGVTMVFSLQNAKSTKTGS